MSKRVRNSRSSHLGHVTSRRLRTRPKLDVEASPVASEYRYTWWPAAVLAPNLPSGFSLALKCLTARDGTRRFAPADGVEDFLFRASLGGLAILTQVRSVDAETRFSYDAMRLIFQHAPRLREHLSRTFAREADLFIPGLERASRDARDILPDRIGLGRGKRNRRWTVTNLLNKGRAHAVAAGEKNPDPAQCIAAGLLVAARLDPIEPSSLTESEALGLIKMALFDYGMIAGKLAETARDLVTDRLLRAIAKHKDDDIETFSRWFFEGRDNIVHQIAKQRKSGGPMPREIVRQALLGLVFDAYAYIADCVCLQMQAFLQALPIPLNDEERAGFEAMYFKQPYFGELPLVMLRERFAFLREGILDVMDDPGGSERVGVLLRLIHYYSDMATRRRDVDREYKKRSQHLDARGKISRTYELDASDMGESKATLNRDFGQIADRLREARGISCPCGATGSWEARLVGGGTGDDVVAIEVVCPKCEHFATIEPTRAEFARVAREVMKSKGISSPMLPEFGSEG
jgi:hypothetical protein